MVKKKYNKGSKNHYFALGGLEAEAATMVAGELSALPANVMMRAKGLDLSNQIDLANSYGTGIIAGSPESLANQWSNRVYLNPESKDDIYGNTKGERIAQVVGDFYSAPVFGMIKAGADLVGFAKSNKEIARLNDERKAANARLDAAFDNAFSNAAKQQQANMLANYSAFGGPIYGYDTFGGGAIGYDMAKDSLYTRMLTAQGKEGSAVGYIPSTSFAKGGKIHIKPSKRGTFTAAAKKHGKSVQAFASQVLANKENYSPAMVKKANFARNAAKWHADGGFLMSDDFTNGVTLINQGGTHENNPHEGVQMGIAPDGKPNLVEQGEAIFNDYVFSNRLKVPKEVRNKYKLRGPKDMTFAEAFREAQKESQERPNDPISQDGLENIAMILARTQEAIRSYESNKKAAGGHLLAYGKNGYYIDDTDLTEVDEPEVRKAIEDFWASYAGDLEPAVVVADTPRRIEPLPMLSPIVASARANAPAGLAEARQLRGLPTLNPIVTEAQAMSEKGLMGNPSIGVPKHTSVEKEEDYTGRSAGNLSWLRYAEPLANAGAVFSDIMGWTNKPYTYDFVPEFQPISYNPIGNYIPETHFDTRYAANQAAQQAAATRNAIMQSTAPSRWANLLAADYNAQITSGELLRNAAMDDYNMMVQREQFNRGTNQANSQMTLEAAMANQKMRPHYAQLALQQAKMNVDETNAASAAKAQNIGNLAESIANIGRESDAKSDRNWLITKGVLGSYSEDDLRNQIGLTEEEIKEIKGDKYVGKKKKACGGRIRRKRGLTY